MSARTTLGRIAGFAALLILFLPSCSNETNGGKERPQWTEEQAWEWEKKVGVIKGFNEPAKGYPGMSLEDIIKKVSEYGLNSVRFWVPGKTAEEQIESIHRYADICEKYGMTISPVLSIQRRKEFFENPDEEQGLKEAEKVIKTILTPFKDDPRIVLWDIWNEPNCDIFLVDGGTNEKQTRHELDWIEKMVHWCREVRLSQPITASIFFDSGANADTSSELFKRRVEVENMMDLHNFHSYACANDNKDIDFTLKKIRAMSDRPIVCTECLTRVNGSGVGRTLAKFADEHVHFYIWGSFISDRNWSVKWLRSTYDSYEVVFHNTMYPDGDYIDGREIDMLREFKFSEPGESADPGIEITERWSHERAWKRMALGPVKGIATSSANLSGIPSVYNSVRVRFSYNDWAKDKDAFFAKTDALLWDAAAKGITVLPVLTDDDDLGVGDDAVAEYVASVVGKYYFDPSVQAWDLYWHPGEKASDKTAVSKRVTSLFRSARNQYSNQPLTATPCVRVKDFETDFNYHDALIHGKTNGWNKLEFPGVSDSDLVHRIWSISDVLSFSTDQPQAEAGWLLSICFRYGRPVFCTGFLSPSEAEGIKTLERFSMSHVFWYTEKPLNAGKVAAFRFLPISTKH